MTILAYCAVGTFKAATRAQCENVRHRRVSLTILTHIAVVLATKSRRLESFEKTLSPPLLPHRGGNENFNRRHTRHKSHAFLHCALATIVSFNLHARCNASLITYFRISSANFSTFTIHLQALRCLIHRNLRFIQVLTII